MLSLEEHRAVLSCFGIPQSERTFSITKGFLHVAISRGFSELAACDCRKPNFQYWLLCEGASLSTLGPALETLRILPGGISLPYGSWPISIAFSERNNVLSHCMCQYIYIFLLSENKGREKRELIFKYLHLFMVFIYFKKYFQFYLPWS